MRKILLFFLVISLLLCNISLTVNADNDIILVENSKDYVTHGFKDLGVYYTRHSVSKWNMPFIVSKLDYSTLSDKDLSGSVDTQASLTSNFIQDFKPKFEYKILAENDNYYIINYIMDVPIKPKCPECTCQELETFSIDFVPEIKGISYNKYAWYNMNWTHRCLLNVNETFVSKDLNNFPVLVSTIENEDLYDRVQNDIEDIVFVDYYDNETIFNHEIENALVGGGVVDFDIWVNLTTVYADTPTYFWMYYNNSDYNGEFYNPTGTWDNEYAFVYHCNDTSGGVEDSTINGDDGTEGSSPTYSQTGSIGYGIDLDGSGDWFDISNSQGIFTGGDFTFEMFAKIHSYANDEVLWSAKGEAKAGLQIHTNTYVRFAYDASGWQTVTCVNNPPNAWRYYGVSYDNDGNAKAYYSGLNVDESSNTGAITSSATSDSGIGGRGSDYMDGVIDEIRLSSCVRSESWIGASYNTSVQDTFIVWGDCGNQAFWEPDEEPTEPENNDTTNTTTGETGSYALDTQQFAIIILLVLFFFAIYKEDNILAVLIHMSIVFMSIIFVTTDIIYSWDFLLFVFIFLNGAIIFYRSYVEIDNRGLK